MAQHHPSVANLLRYFAHDHLPPQLRDISQPFGELAYDLVERRDLDGPELTVALRKLLEAKDCAVRAALPVPAGKDA
ncbi:hypothetical protein [Streptomyces zaomyceticus]|uniref:hypothetical protein n=1 Tax=Streptomyces zaomyceticus TaxID=68286 RepID=UPI0037A2BC8A